MLGHMPYTKVLLIHTDIYVTVVVLFERVSYMPQQAMLMPSPHFSLLRLLRQRFPACSAASSSI